MAIDRQDSEIIYAATSNGAFKSVDGGGDWQQLPALDAEVRWIEIDPATPTTLYAGASRFGEGVFMLTSDDGGGSWNRFGESLDCPALAEQLLVAPSDPALMYAIACSTVFRSRDTGRAWEPANQGFPPDAYVGVLRHVGSSEERRFCASTTSQSPLLLLRRCT